MGVSAIVGGIMTAAGAGMSIWGAEKQRKRLRRQRLYLEGKQREIRELFRKYYEMKGGFKELSQTDTYKPTTIQDYVNAQRDRIMSMQEKGLEQLSTLYASKKLDRSGMALSSLIGLKSKLADNVLASAILAEEQMNKENLARRLAMAEAGAKGLAGIENIASSYDKYIYQIRAQNPMRDALINIASSAMKAGGTMAGGYFGG